MALYICQSTLNFRTQRVNLNVCSLKSNLGGQGYQKGTQSVTRESKCITNVRQPHGREWLCGGVE